MAEAEDREVVVQRVADEDAALEERGDGVLGVLKGDRVRGWVGRREVPGCDARVWGAVVADCDARGREDVGVVEDFGGVGDEGDAG